MTVDKPTMEVQNSEHILIIDDDAAMAELIKQILDYAGYRTEIALTGAEGVKSYTKNRHDLVVTDLQIGDMTGIDVLQAVKKVAHHTPVIILTGYASTETAMEAIRLGAADYMTKPFRMQDLLKTIKTYLI